ncbi:hypothetical protein CASFOL_008864 [Castilleja foliolosa]|uniref:BHLH domain-containing protein n=1 Tax=Castilleja foliolosa TaxID=1961234 RepID=A0ABD3E1B6_9LAMI
MGEPDCEDKLQFSPLDMYWLPKSNAYGLHDDHYRYQHNLPPGTSNMIHQEQVLVPPWMHCQQTPPQYVEFLTETGCPEIQKQMPYGISDQLPNLGIADASQLQDEHSGLPNVGNFITTFTGLVPQYGAQKQNWNEEPRHGFQAYSVSGTKCTSKARRKRSREKAYAADHSSDDGRPTLKEYQGLPNLGSINATFTGMEPKYGVQEQNWNEEPSHAFQAYSGPGPSALECTSEARRQRSREKSYATDRCRRLKISHWLDELKELVPQSQDVGKEDVLDNVIDHVKYLQSQVKDLSRSRLGGERISNSVIYLEGHGHYILEEQMLNGPLEQTMEKLIDVYPLAATELLQSRGLFAMPLSLVEGLREPIEMLSTLG